MNDMPIWLQLIAVVIGLTIIANHFWPDIVAVLEQRRVARNRAELATHGLTPERYMATISPADYQSYAEAVFKFWPKRTRKQRRDTTFDRIGAALDPTAAKDIRELKASANRLAQD